MKSSSSAADKTPGSLIVITLLGVLGPFLISTGGYYRFVGPFYSALLLAMLARTLLQSAARNRWGWILIASLAVVGNVTFTAALILAFARD